MLSKRKEFIARLILLFCSILVCLLIIEGTMRARQWIKYGQIGGKAYRTEVHPVLGLRVPVVSQNTGLVKTDSRGFRNSELDHPKPSGRIRLAFLRGSTTFCAEATSNETTWPHLVWKILQERFPDVKFDYINAGIPGYTADYSLRNLQVRVAPLKPDVIVIYHATNDLSFDTRELARKKGLFSGHAEEPSFLARWSLAWYLIEKNLQIRQRQQKATASTGRLEFNPHELSSGFRSRLHKLIDSSRKVASIVAVATFSHKMRIEQSFEDQLRNSNTSLYYMPYMTVEGLLLGFEEYNQVITEVTRKNRAILIGGENTIPGDNNHFNDSVHFKDLGNMLMARRVVNGLLKSQAFQVLVKDSTQQDLSKITESIRQP